MSETIPPNRVTNDDDEIGFRAGAWLVGQRAAAVHSCYAIRGHTCHKHIKIRQSAPNASDCAQARTKYLSTFVPSPKECHVVDTIRAGVQFRPKVSSALCRELDFRGALIQSFRVLDLIPARGATVSIAGRGLIPVRVINLKECDERREHTKREMAEAQIPFVFVPAISKNDVQETSTLTRNQLACAMSHLHAIGLIAEGEDEWGAVFEDDMFVSPDARQFLEVETLRTLPRFDILQPFVTTTKSVLTIPIGQFRGHTIVTRTRPYTSMQALIYSRDAARRIVRKITKISAPIDEMLFSQAAVFGLRIISLRPAIVRHGDEFASNVLAPSPKLSIPQKLRRELRRATNCFWRAASLITAWSRLRLDEPHAADEAGRDVAGRAGAGRGIVCRNNDARGRVLDEIAVEAVIDVGPISGIISGNKIAT